jgi:hypothetical protein
VPYGAEARKREEVNWFSQALIIIFAFIIVMVLLNRRNTPNTWPTCGCGHESSWHRNEGGCAYKKYGADEKFDYVGNCTCPRSHDEVERKVGGQTAKSG